MTSYPADLIDLEFVDREPQRSSFQAMIASDRRRILCIRAGEGWGKTWLVTRLYHEAIGENYLRVLIDLRSSDAASPEFLLTAIGEKLGGAIAQEMEPVWRSGEAGVSILSEKAVNIHGDIAGHTMIKIFSIFGKSQVSVTPNDNHERIMREKMLTQAFTAGLKKLAPSQRAVLFLDNYELATPETKRWLTDTLFNGVRPDGGLDRLMIVVAGNEDFSFFSPREWITVVDMQLLTGLPVEAIREYWLEKRHLPARHLDTIVELLIAQDCYPLQMGQFADQIANRQRRNGGAGYVP